ncbi:hypothetical protein [Chryseobacterium sp. MP_3.2]|uniref:hypothetical protein n=1 Tax=Chryseobacterium sp. MP_3.2 TaxID=3071712 RepID=UPI002DF83951|nr:hypothetical protein [Chryseobacterium sp. MP_3.2]
MDSKRFTTVLIHLSLGLLYLTSGFSKLAPENLGNIIGPVKLNFISDSRASWYFMVFIAVYQIIAGALTLSQRYSLVGLILLLPLSVGILIFTLVVEFGGTPFINLFILLLLLYALYQEKNSLTKILRFNFEGLKESNSFQRFPNHLLPKIALGIISLTLSLVFLQHSILNILLSFALLLFTANLFQFIKYLLLDKILIFLFLFISLFIVNGHLKNQVFPESFAYIFIFILIGIILYFIRVVYYFKWEKRLKK